MPDLQIMVVEDESIVALDIQHRLKKLGYTITGVVSSGEEAVVLAGETQPDLILMDIMLEGSMDGIQAAGEIRARHGIPVVFLTAYADEETLQRAKITEPFGYIIKPFEDREIHTTIEMARYKHVNERNKREQQSWLSATLRSIADGLITTDPQGRVSYMNPIAEGLIGTRSSEAHGRNIWEVVSLRDESGGEDLAGMIRAVLERGHMVNSEDMQLCLRSGREVPVEVFGSPIQGLNGHVTGAALAFRDITGRKDNEVRLRNSVETLRRTLQETVNALGRASEKRDPYTAGHQQRVALLACAVAHAMGLEDERIEGIRVAALLHDLGKIYIPAEILSKPAKLTEMEFGIMKTHPEVGWDIIRSVPFPWPVADMVHQHHERLDGSGYPKGLTGDEILLESRIIAVADVVEAMSSHRPYRAALGMNRALEEVARGRGEHYDADVVDTVLELVESGGFSFED